MKEASRLNTNKYRIIKKLEDEIIIWQPALRGETGGTYKHSYSESNGEAVGKGFVLNGGWDNYDRWEASYEFKHDNIQYTGICFLAELGTYNGNGADVATILTTWEGSWCGGSNYANYRSGSVGYFDITVTKLNSTFVRLRSTSLNRDTTVQITWLANAKKLTIGARHNHASSSYGPCRIRNVKVIVPQLYYNGIALTSDNITLASNYSIILSAQLTNNGISVSGTEQQIVFEFIKKDNSIVDLITTPTNSNGVASIIYSCQNSEDVIVRAYHEEIPSNSIEIVNCYSQAIYTYTRKSTIAQIINLVFVILG